MISFRKQRFPEENSKEIYDFLKENIYFLKKI